MNVRISRIVLAAVCLMWLAGCETTSTGPDSMKSLASASADPEATAPAVVQPVVDVKFERNFISN